MLYAMGGADEWYFDEVTRMCMNGWSHAFANYEARVRSFVESKQAGAERFVPFFASQSRLGIWLRDQAMRAMSFELLVKLFAGRTLHDDFELPGYDM